MFALLINKTSETYKTQAAQLLESLCDHLDGTLTQITYFLINIMKYSIESNVASDIPQKYPVLTEFASCRFIERKSAEIRVETCLLILTLISYHMPKRKDLIKGIEDFLTIYVNFFMNNQSKFSV